MQLAQSNNLLHGLALEIIPTRSVEALGWKRAADEAQSALAIHR